MLSGAPRALGTLAWLACVGSEQETADISFHSALDRRDRLQNGQH